MNVASVGLAPNGTRLSGNCYRSSSWPPSGLSRREPRLDATVPPRVFILVPAAAKRRPERAEGDDVIDLGSGQALLPSGRARRRHVCNPVR